MGRPAQRAKAFFKTKTASEYGVELLRMFILPFLKAWDPRASIDDAIAAFFAVGTREIFEGTALSDFKMPGEIALTGNLYAKRSGKRQVLKGQELLLVIDIKDQIASVQVGEEMFRLRRPELEYLKDRVEIRKT